MGRDMMRLRRGILLNTPHEEPASGAVASFATEVQKLKECVVNIEPVQEGTGDPSPDNVRPISGWSEAKVYDDPKYGGTVWWNQQFPAASEWKAHSVQSSVSVSDGVITATLISGTPTVYSPAITITGGTIVTTIAKHKYYMACKFNPAADGYPYLRNNTAFSSGGGVFGSKTTRAGEWGSYENITSATATGGPAWYLGNAGNTSQIQIGDSFSIKDLMCIDLTAMFGAGNEPATVADFRALFPNDYYAYNAGEETLVSAVNGDPYQAVTIDLDGTRYGGTLDVLTGKIRLYPCYASYNGETLVGPWISSMDKYVAGTTPTIGAQVVDFGGEVTTVQLSPTQLKAFKGQNNIFADTGDSSVKYWKHGG